MCRRSSATQAPFDPGMKAGSAPSAASRSAAWKHRWPLFWPPLPTPGFPCTCSPNRCATAVYGACRSHWAVHAPSRCRSSRFIRICSGPRRKRPSMRFTAIFPRSSSVLERADQMRRDRPFADLKAAHRLLERLIRLGDTLVLRQMLQPRIGEKGFNETALHGGILEDAPLVSAIPAARLGVSTESIQKGLTILRIDALFDRHQNRSPVGLYRVSRDRVRPMHGRREVDV